MAYGSIVADLMTTSDGVSSAGLYGFKNRIINGSMQIDQRNAGASVTPSNTGQYLVDRWFYNGAQSSKVTAQQNSGSVTPPAGYTNYQGIVSSSAYSVLSTDYFQLTQAIEGLNVADFAWGTASAATVTLSFWVRSSLTGTFGGSFRNSATNRSYPFSYAISSANTWEQKSVTIAGDTSGTWLTTNGVGIYVAFSLGSGTTFSGTSGAWVAGNLISATGATSVVGTNGATFYITGVQLEKGSTATSFDYRPYGTELQLCQRYLPAFNGTTIIGTGWCASATQAYIEINHIVTPRVSPTGITTSAVGTFTIYGNSATSITPTAITLNAGGTQGSRIGVTTASGLTNGSGTGLYANGSTSQLLFTGCEL